MSIYSALWSNFRLLGFLIFRSSGFGLTVLFIEKYHDTNNTRTGNHDQCRNNDSSRHRSASKRNDRTQDINKTYGDDEYQRHINQELKKIRTQNRTENLTVQDQKFMFGTASFGTYMTRGLSIEDAKALIAALKIQENLQSRMTLQNEGVINTSQKSTQNGGN